MKMIPVSVKAVTVYPDRARIGCQGTAQLTSGAQTLVVDELPLTLLPDSLRATGRGLARVRIFSVDLKRHNYVESPAGNVQALVEQIEALDEEMRVLNDNHAGIVAQAQYINGMRQATAQYAKGIAQGRSSVEDQAKLIAFLGEQDSELRAAQRQVEIDQKELKGKIDKLKRDLAQLQSQRPRQRYQALIEIEAMNDGDFELELNYVVNQASWQPLYDLRLSKGDGAKSSLAVSYLAQVTQNSGQDWNGVKLTLSTARPALNQRLPKLRPWYIDEFRPQLRQPAARKQSVQSRQLMAADAMPEAAAFAMEEAPVAAEIVEAEAVDSGASVQFTAGGDIDIPSDGSPHKTMLQQFDLPYKLDYLAVPRHTDAVFRRATITNNSAGALLAGNASLFVNEEFIGSTRLNFTAREEEFELMLGVEERIPIKRELAKRDVDKRLLRDNRQARFGYELEIQNLLPATAAITVQDQIPVSRHERIKVKLEKTSPNPAKQSDLNELEWQIELPPNDKKIIHYEFLVEHPTEMQISGLSI